jgi:hypothetical protein
MSEREFDNAEIGFADAVTLMLELGSAYLEAERKSSPHP